MKRYPGNLLKRSWQVLAAAASAFRRNNDLTAASSLAFSATLALIPALFLLTVLLGAAIGSSTRVIQRTQELVVQLIPAYSQVVLREVNFIASHKRTIGLLNLLVLFWSITPLVAEMRLSLGTIFRKKPARPYLLEKLLDAAIGILFIVGLAVVSVAGVFFSVIQSIQPLRHLPGFFEQAGFFAVISGIVLALYFTFSKGARFRHLLIGSLVTALLWFALRPAFHLFLTYNPGYGFAFGSFKSLFVVIIWIYISLALFLFGAEVVAVLGRAGTAPAGYRGERGKTLPTSVLNRYVVRSASGEVIFQDGDPGSEMFSVLRGRVAIRKGNREIAVIPQGKSFGALSFLLSRPRSATAVALEDVELVFLNSENVSDLMKEFPELALGMLRDAALRLQETGALTDQTDG